jgi:hypothetical protein
MTFIWLIVWLFSGVPAVHPWNGWLIALIVCVVIDLIGAIERNS